MQSFQSQVQVIFPCGLSLIAQLAAWSQTELPRNSPFFLLSRQPRDRAYYQQQPKHGADK